MDLICRLFPLLAAVALLAACAGETPEPTDQYLTYTQVQGDQTTEIIEALNYGERLGDVEIRPLPVPTDVLSYEPYVLSLSTGSTAIDAYLLDAPWVKRYSATNWLAPIDLNANAFDLSAFRGELIDVTSIDDNGKRKVLAIPFETKGNILFYRKDLLDQFGFRPPATWEDLFQQCNVILGELGTEGPRFGFLFHGTQFINDFYPIVWGFGGEIIDGNGEPSIDRPENVRALATIKRMLGTISPDPLQMEQLGIFADYKAIDRVFAAGQSIFMINWNLRYGDLLRGIESQRISIEQIGIAPIPSERGRPSYSNIGSFSWGINFSSPNIRAAQHLIQLITSYEAQRWRALHQGIVPARWDVLSDEEVRDKAPEVIEMAIVFEQVQLRARPFQREISTILDEMLIAALQKDLDPLDVLREAQGRIVEELRWIMRHREEEE